MLTILNVFYLQARRYSEGLSNSVWTNQFDNTANRKAHIETTGPEIWQQTDGKVSAVTFSTGTGGTLAGRLYFPSVYERFMRTILGVGTFLKSKNPDIKVVCADPQV